MNLLFMSLDTIDDINQSGIYHDLLRKFAQNQYQIYIISPLEKRKQKKTYKIQKENITYLHIQIGNITKSSLIQKGIATITLQRNFKRAITKELKGVEFDLVLYSTPPITFGKIIEFIKKRDGAKTYLLLKDIFPQNAVDLEMFSKKSPLYYYFRRKETHLYQISDHIGTMSQANSHYLMKHNPTLDIRKVEVAPNALEPIDFKVTHNDKIRIRQKYHIPLEKTVYIYGGNLGKPQGIDFLIKCLLKNEENLNTFILICGGGTEYEKLNQFFSNNQLKNAKLLPFLPREDYELLVHASDVGLIFLDYRFTIPNFPSRLLSYMQAHMPIISATDPHTDIGDIIEEGKFGYKVFSNNVEDFNQHLLTLTDVALRKEMGLKARKYLENHFTADHTYKIINKHFIETGG